METVNPEVMPRSFGRVLWYWGPAVGYALLIFYLSSLPHPEEQLPEFLFQRFNDKALHLIEYGILAVLCYRAFRWAAGPVAARQAVALAIVAASVYGLMDEAHQAMVPTREASLLDWVADTIGAAAGSFGWSRFVRS
jgi:VanZ family protein